MEKEGGEKGGEGGRGKGKRKGGRGSKKDFAWTCAFLRVCVGASVCHAVERIQDSQSVSENRSESRTFHSTPRHRRA
jgi:hypothetical protein